MIISEVKGNLIDSFLNNELDILVHGCNCFNTMGAGIAREVKERIPKAYNIDLTTKKGDISKLGTYSKIETENGLVINAYTQYYYGRPKKGIDCLLDYTALRSIFVSLNNLYPNSKVGIPFIGCGLAGGNWDKVKDIINGVTPNLLITLYVM